jgi:polysaccharide biosynthesis transport protein
MTATTPGTAYVAVSRRTLDLEDYIDVARRHAAWILGPMFAGIVISTVWALMVPNTYVSEAVLQITPAQISENIVKTTVNQRLTERISEMQQNILSRTTLSTIIQDPRLDLYKADRAQEPIEDVIETMRTRDIRIRVSALPGDDNHGASAFSISFAYPDRVKAHDTVQTLVTKFEDENQNSQRTQQKMVDSFVRDQLSSAKAKLDQTEQELAAFRVQNAGKLPEQVNLNMAQLAALQQTSNGINDALNRAAQDRVQLDARLATLESQKQLAESLEKDADASSPVVQQNERLALLNRQIADGESQLNAMQQVFTANYPDIRDLKNKLASLRTERDALQNQDATAKPAPPPSKATNFKRAEALNSLDGQINSVKAQLKVLDMEDVRRKKDQQTATDQLQTYEGRLAATTGIESRYADLTRESQAAREKYQLLQAQQGLTEQNGELLSLKAGEQLDVLDPPSLPTSPSKPNRWMYVGGGTAISFILGLAFAGIQEAKDTSLKNLKDVRAYTNLPVLCSIPLLENTLVVRRKRRIAYLAWSAAVIVGVVAIVVALYWQKNYAV